MLPGLWPTSVPDIISTVLWIFAGIVQFVALAIMARRKFFREFPAFFSYLVVHVIEDLVAFYVERHFGRASRIYFDQYWIAQAILIALRFGVIYEIFSLVFQPYEGLRQLAAVLFRWAGLALLLMAIFTAVAGPGNEPYWAFDGSIIVERSIDLVQCGLLIFLYLFSSYFGLTWRHQVYGIALGFGLIASIELVASAVGTEFSSLTNFIVNFLPRAAYDSAATIWIVYLLSSEPSRPRVAALPQHDLEKWNLELLQLLRR
jgi:hypothetical protein